MDSWPEFDWGFIDCVPGANFKQQTREPKILAGITEQSKKHKMLFDVLTYDLSSQLIDDKRIAYTVCVYRTHSFKLIYSLLPMSDEYDVLPGFALIS